MILLLILLIFLIRVGIKIALVGITVSSYIHSRYKKIQSSLKKDDEVVKQEKFSDKAVVAIKTTTKAVAKVAKTTVNTILTLCDLALGLLNKLLICALGYVIILDTLIFLMIVSACGWYLTVYGDKTKADYLIATTETVYNYNNGGSGGSNEGTGGGTGDENNSGDDGGGTESSGSSDQDVYSLLASDSMYAGKASALAMVYNQASARWGREVAVGLMANVVAEGSPGKIEGINFKSAFERGAISSSRKVVLSCGCSKNGTVTIDYWALAPCSAHEIAGTTIDSMSDVSAMLSIGDDVPGIGVGSIQWSGGRRQGILQKYSNLSNFSSSNLLMADVQYIMEELNGSYNSVIASCSGKNASECAKVICNNYEKPGTSNAAVTRASIANDLSIKLSSIGK